jgi:hypothetical protein
VSVNDGAPARPRLAGTRLRELARVLPDPLLCLPLVLLSTLLLASAAGRITCDTWFDIVTGRDIAAHGLPHTDRLMAFTAGRAWSDQQWLAHLVAYGLYGLGGMPLVVLADGACIVAAVAIAIATARMLGANSAWAAAVATPTMLLLLSSAVRAQSYAYPLFAAVLLVLVRDARRGDRRVLFLIPLLVVWANTHGSVLLGGALVGLYAAIGAIRAVRARAWHGLLRPAGLAAIALLAPFASPYGPGLIRYYGATATSSSFHQYVTEWSGTTLRAWPFFFALAAFVVVVVVRPETRLPLFDLLCLCVLLLAGLDTVRNTVWLSFAAVALVPPALQGWRDPGAIRARLRVLLGGVALLLAAATGLIAATLTDRSLNRSLPVRPGAAIAREAALHPAWKIVTDGSEADWMLMRYPSLQGRIAFDVRFELLGGGKMVQAVRFLDVTGLDWDRPFASYRLALIHRKALPQLARALRARPGARVLARQKGYVALLLPPQGR